MRWHDYVLERGDGLSAFWIDHFNGQDSQPLFLMARSFDPRTCTALEQLLATGAVNDLNVYMLHYDSQGEAIVDEDLERRAAENQTSIETLLRGTNRITPVNLRTDSDGRRRNTAMSARNIFRTNEDIGNYSDIIVDISGMPRSVFFPLISQLIGIVDQATRQNNPPINIFVLVSEDPKVDAAIKHEGVDTFAEYLPFFRGTTERGAGIDLPTVWLPILGEDRLAQLDCIENHLSSKSLEIWPILPSPSRNPRREVVLV